MSDPLVPLVPLTIQTSSDCVGLLSLIANDLVRTWALWDGNNIDIICPPGSIPAPDDPVTTSIVSSQAELDTLADEVLMVGPSVVT